MGAYGLFLTLRMVWAGFAAPFEAGLPVDPTIVSLLAFLALLMMSSFAVLLVSLTKERGEARHRSDAQTDVLTGLPNRRAFEQAANAALRGIGGITRPLALVMLDIDHFKSVNDRHGHDAGDRLLLAFAELARLHIRSSDAIYRIGGEEFCLLLPNAGVDEALAVGERLRLSFSSFSLALTEEVRTTVSLGIASTARSGVNLQNLLSDADRALYRAKALGRDRAIIAGEFAPAGGLTELPAAS